MRATFIRRAFQDGKLLTRIVVLLPAKPRNVLAAAVLGTLRATSGIVENQDTVVAERDLLRLPGGALVMALGLCAGGISFLIKPVESRVFVRDPFLDGLPSGVGLSISFRRIRFRSLHAQLFRPL